MEQEAKQSDYSACTQRVMELDLVSTLKPNEMVPLQIKDMSDRDLARYWSNYVKEIAVLLVSVEGDPHPPEEVIGRIQELVQKELLFLYIRFGCKLSTLEAWLLDFCGPLIILWRKTSATTAQTKRVEQTTVLQSAVPPIR